MVQVLPHSFAGDSFGSHNAFRTRARDLGNTINIPYIHPFRSSDDQAMEGREGDRTRSASARFFYSDRRIVAWRETRH